jgi:uncharacterized protein YacL
MSVEFAFRIVGMLALGGLGWQLGVWLGGSVDAPSVRYTLSLALAGAALGLLITPYITLRPFAWLRKGIRQASAQQMAAVSVGLVVGLVVAALCTLPLSLLPSYWGKILPAVVAVVFGALGASIASFRQRELFAILGGRGGHDAAASPDDDQVLLDTSVIIDGRIADISHTGFLRGTLLVPRFVLYEIQHIADSPDTVRRNRGRRGLDMLNRLQKDSVVPVRISDIDIEDVREVDDKLVVLAKRLRCPIVTNDYNLNRVAELQGVPVLNINELASAVRAVVLPGESLGVHIIQEGKELGQGVGYLDDGTMVVVENGRRSIGQNVPVIVTKVLQTSAGRMVFAQPEGR